MKKFSSFSPKNFKLAFRVPNNSVMFIPRQCNFSLLVSSDRKFYTNNKKLEVSIFLLNLNQCFSTAFLNQN
jgi:hypothetical protein